VAEVVLARQQDFIFGGLFQWGVFGEGPPARRNRHRATVAGGGILEVPRPGQHVLPRPAHSCCGISARWCSSRRAKVYLGFEYQIAFHRYLIENKSENVMQGMVRWNI